MAEILTPVVFIHGTWLHAGSWENWAKLFRRLGYAPIAPGWPGEADEIREARLLPEAVAGTGLQALTKHYADIIAQQDEKPIVIGHSVGGLVAQKLLGQNLAAAAIAIAPAQPKGVWLLPLRQINAVFPALKNPLNIGRAIELTANNFRYAFGNTLSLEESTELYTQWVVPSPAKPLFEAAFANFIPGSPAAVNTGNAERGPLLLMAGGRDNTVPASVVRAQQRLYIRSPAVTDIHEFPDRGHSLTIDNGWREVTDTVIDWLKLRVQ
jgi:pimeloyl-ACP methyl ester carboxylesterase